MEFILLPSPALSGFHFLVLPTLMMRCTNGFIITGYAIMPNHLHMLIAFSNSGKNINKIIGNGKRFMAYDIVGKLKEKGMKISWINWHRE